MTIGWDEQGYPLCACNEKGIGAYWCSHIKSFIVNGEDKLNEDAFGAVILVPVFPVNGTWVEVEISDERLGNSAAMTMLYVTDFGQQKSIPLGYWNQGEGRFSIRTVILDWLKGQIDPRDDNNSPVIRYTSCPAGAVHNFQNQKRIEKNRSVEWKWNCLWNIVMEKACTPCREDSSGIEDNLVGVEAEPPPWAGRRHK